MDWLNLTLFDLASYLIDANQRIFILYLITSALIASVIYAFSQRKPGLVHFLLNRKVWLHASSVADYKIWIINKFIRVILVTPLLFSSIPIAIWVNELISTFQGPAGLPQTATLTQAFGFTLILFLLDDFSRFLLHWLMHKIPLLWAFHQVHHSAEVLTPFSVYRIHPVESALYALRMVVVQGLSIGIGTALFGINLTMLDILGANLFIFGFNLLGANLRHSHVWFVWPSWLQHWLICPAQHQMHHGRQVKYYDCNFGTCLSIWDKLFFSFKLAPKVKPYRLEFGLAKTPSKSAHKLTNLYFLPFKYAWLSLVSFLKKRLNIHFK